MRRRALFNAQVGDRTYQGDELGKPIITETSEGKVISWEATESMSFTGANNIETHFLLTYDDGFELYVAGTVKKSSIANNATIVNAMDESSTNYPGFCIRKSSSSYLKLYYGNSSSQVSKIISGESNVAFAIKCTKPANSSTMTVNWGDDNSFSINLSFSANTQVLIGSSVNASGSYQRYAVCTISEFYVKTI